MTPQNLEIYFKDYGTEPYVYVAHKASKPSFGSAASLAQVQLLNWKSKLAVVIST